MSILFILFIISLAGVVGMIAYRMLVAPTSSRAVLPDSETKSDGRTTDPAELWFVREMMWRVFFPHIKRLLVRGVRATVPVARYTVSSVRKGARKHYGSFVAKMNDNTEHSKRGAASVFLKNISNHKEGLKKRAEKK